MKYKAIIFDLDGTIIDTQKLWNKVHKNFLIKKNIKCSPQALLKFQEKTHGIGLRDSAPEIKQLFNLPDSIEEIIGELSTDARQLYQQEVTFIEGFLPFHTKVIEQNFKTGIATNASYTLPIAIKVLKLDTYFGSHIYNPSYVNNRPKPDPALYLYAAQQLEVAPSQCIAIEDSAKGIQAAQAAGMFCIGINTSGNQHALEKANIRVQHYDHINITTLNNKIL